MADSNEARDRSNPLTVIEGARGLREALDRGNYTEAALGKLFASERLQPASAIERAAALHRTRGGSPLELLARLFLLGATLSESEARRALADTALDDWLRSGLLVRTDEGVQGACAIQPFRGHLF